MLIKILLVPFVIIGLLLLGMWWFTARTARKVEQALPASGRFIDVPGARLHVVERGQGPALVLIHGLGGQCCHFTYGVVDQLASHFRVIAVDRPGSGYSTRNADTSASLETQAKNIVALIDALQLERPFVVGHSLGGAVALALALNHPQRIAGLALIAPLTQMTENVSPVFKGLMIPQAWVRTLVAWTLATPATVLQGKKMLGLVFGPEPVPADFATRGGGLLSLRPSQFIAASTDLQAAPDSMRALQTRYGELHMPVSVLYGRQDRILDPINNGEDFVAKISGAKLDMVDGGHMLPVTNPTLTADFIRRAAGGMLT